MYLAPPEPILYEDVGGFLFYREQSQDAHGELDIQDYRRRIPDPNTLTVKDLRNHAVRLVSATTGSDWRTWSVYRCLVHETNHAGKAYLLSEGDWFELDSAFVERVNREVASIATSTILLPAAIVGESESDYNVRAGAAGGLAVLDSKLIQVGGTAIEVADLVGPGGHLIHVKRKTQSATLSHLFSQGRISAETLKGDDGARRAAADLLDVDGRVSGNLLRSPFDPRTKTVVYAVIAKNAGELPGRLPFFSRLNLWQAKRFLSTSLDYNVEFVGVPFV